MTGPEWGEKTRKALERQANHVLLTFQGEDSTFGLWQAGGEQGAFAKQVSHTDDQYPTELAKPSRPFGPRFAVRIGSQRAALASGAKRWPVIVNVPIVGFVELGLSRGILKH
jgi:hypothetical protein